MSALSLLHVLLSGDKEAVSFLDPLSHSKGSISALVTLKTSFPKLAMRPVVYNENSLVPLKFIASS